MIGGALGEARGDLWSGFVEAALKTPYKLRVPLAPAEGLVLESQVGCCCRRRVLFFFGLPAHYKCSLPSPFLGRESRPCTPQDLAGNGNLHPVKR